MSEQPADHRDHVVSFRIAGRSGTDTLGRVAGLLVQLGPNPVRLTMNRCRDATVLEIVQDRLDLTKARIVAEKMRSLVSVPAVDLTVRDAPQSAVEEVPDV